MKLKQVRERPDTFTNQEKDLQSNIVKGNERSKAAFFRLVNLSKTWKDGSNSREICGDLIPLSGLILSYLNGILN